MSKESKYIEKVKYIEKEVLPELLKDINNWDSLLVDYHPPIVERLFTFYEGERISLHYIHPCEILEALLHSHPWIAGFKVMAGTYRTGIGYSETAEPPKIISQTITDQPMYYDMTDPNLWHYVAPITPVSTLMVNGPLFENINPACKKADKELFPLENLRKTELFNHFKSIIL